VAFAVFVIGGTRLRFLGVTNPRWENGTLQFLHGETELAFSPVREYLFPSHPGRMLPAPKERWISRPRSIRVRTAICNRIGELICEGKSLSEATKQATKETRQQVLVTHKERISQSTDGGNR
jgi:hypothetical protein